MKLKWTDLYKGKYVFIIRLLSIYNSIKSLIQFKKKNQWRLAEHIANGAFIFDKPSKKDDGFPKDHNI